MKCIKCGYSNCENELREDLHGNRKFCSNKCYNENKKKVTNEKNAAIRSYIQLNMNDDILKLLHDKYGSEKYINAAELEVKKFKWEVYNKVISKSVYKAYLVKDYAYTLFNNQQIFIWKM